MATPYFRDVRTRTGSGQKDTLLCITARSITLTFVTVEHFASRNPTLPRSASERCAVGSRIIRCYGKKGEGMDRVQRRKDIESETCRTRQVRDGEEASLKAWHQGFSKYGWSVLLQLSPSVTGCEEVIEPLFLSCGIRSYQGGPLFLSSR